MCEGIFGNADKLCSIWQAVEVVATLAEIRADLDRFAGRGWRYWRGDSSISLGTLPHLTIVEKLQRPELGPDGPSQAVEDAIELAASRLQRAYKQAALIHLGFAREGFPQDEEGRPLRPERFAARAERERSAAGQLGISAPEYRWANALTEGQKPCDYILDKVAEQLGGEWQDIEPTPGQSELPPPSAPGSDLADISALLDAIHPRAKEDSVRLLRAAISKSIGRLVIRDNWTLDLRFNLDHVASAGRLVELIYWSYDLINIGREAFEYALGVTSLRDEHFGTELVSLVRTLADGSEETVAARETFSGADAAMFPEARAVVTLDPATRYTITMRFRQGWPVNRTFPQVHNSFSPRESCLRTRLRFTVPAGYQVGVILTSVGIKHQQFEDVHEFVLPQFLLAGNSIEYILRPKDVISST